MFKISERVISGSDPFGYDCLQIGLSNRAKKKPRFFLSVVEGFKIVR